MTSLGEVRAGDTLGRYELLVPIAQGGMAVVWAARMKGTRGFQKTVAIKCMLPQLSEDAQFEEMFLAEAELASRIRHPNVCEILDLGEQEGILYIVMEWVDGEPLSTLQKATRTKGGVPIPIATRIAFHAAAGLHAAHELRDDGGELVGLVHRDVSPQNILVTYDGVVKIVDFGVAKATTAAEGSHTRAGQVKGKIPFMSPEQASGRNVDRRTDVFALGIVLWQMLVGKHPFRGENDMATLHRILDDEPVPAVASLVPACPASLSAALAQALEKDVDKRFATMADFARALEKSLAEMTSAGDEQDVGGFVRSVLGERADKRRAALKDAVRRAEERAKEPPESQARPSSSSELSALSIPSAMNAPVTGTGVSVVTRLEGASRPAISSPPTEAPFVVAGGEPRAAPGRGKIVLAVAGAAVALGVATFFALGRASAPADGAGVATSSVIATGASATPSASAPAPTAPAVFTASATPSAAAAPSVSAAAASASAAAASASAVPSATAPEPPPSKPHHVAPHPARPKPPTPTAPTPGGGVINPGF